MIKLEKCNCLYKVNLPADELNVFRVITDINILKGSFIMEYPSYTQEYLESILIEDIKNNDIGKIKGYVYLKDDITNETKPGRFLLQLSRELKLQDIMI